MWNVKRETKKGNIFKFARISQLSRGWEGGISISHVSTYLKQFEFFIIDEVFSSSVILKTLFNSHAISQKALFLHSRFNWKSEENERNVSLCNELWIEICWVLKKEGKKWIFNNEKAFQQTNETIMMFVESSFFLLNSLGRRKTPFTDDVLTIKTFWLSFDISSSNFSLIVFECNLESLFRKAENELIHCFIWDIINKYESFSSMIGPLWAVSLKTDVKSVGKTCIDLMVCAFAFYLHHQHLSL